MTGARTPADADRPALAIASDAASLLHCLHSPVHDRAALWRDWHRQHVLEHLGPLAARALPAAWNAIRTVVPDEPRLSLLAGVHRQCWAGNQRMLVELGRLLAQFERLGESVVLCGPVARLADPVPGEALERIDEIECLIEASALARLRTALEDDRWCAVTRQRTIDTARRGSLGFERDGVRLRLIWYPIAQRPLADWSRQLVARALPCSIGERTTRRLDPTDELLFALVGCYTGMTYRRDIWPIRSLTVLNDGGLPPDMSRLHDDAVQLGLSLPVGVALDTLRPLVPGLLDGHASVSLRTQQVAPHLEREFRAAVAVPAHGWRRRWTLGWARTVEFARSESRSPAIGAWLGDELRCLVSLAWRRSGLRPRAPAHDRRSP